jgi:hypothetical protein
LEALYATDPLLERTALKKRHLPFLCLLLIFALVLAACGGGGGESDEAQIEAAIVASATGTDPADCTRISTQAFVEQSSNESGKGAVKACEKETKNPSGTADSVTVSKVNVNGSKATANAAVTGSGFDGQTVSIALVEEGGQWKLDQITGFAKLDTAALAKTFEKQLKTAEGLTPKQTGCIVEAVEEATRAEAEALVLSGSSAALIKLAESCQ